MCFSGYITIDRTEPSKSGYYVVDLPGITVRQLHDLAKDEQDDYQALFENIYGTAQINLERDVQEAIGERFHYDQKLVSRETSKILATVNASAALSGVKIEFSLPKYARLTIVSIGFYAEENAISPEPAFYIYKDDENGELLSTITAEVTEGRNTIQVEEYFEEDTLFVAYNASDLQLRKTENKYYSDWTYATDKLSCSFPCYFGQTGSVQQINGGGLNVKFIVTCSMEKFICENLPIFKKALWYRIGVDLMKERIVSDRVTRFTVISEERATELMGVYSEDYQKALAAATKTIKITEDPVCFLCKAAISTITDLP